MMKLIAYFSSNCEVQTLNTFFIFQEPPSYLRKSQGSEQTQQMFLVEQNKLRVSIKYLPKTSLVINTMQMTLKVIFSISR